MRLAKEINRLIRKALLNMRSSLALKLWLAEFTDPDGINCLS